MDAASLAALLVAVLALAGVVWTRVHERRERWTAVVLDESAEIIAFEHSFRISLYRKHGPNAKGSDWDPTSAPKRRSEAKIRLVSRDEQLVTAMDDLGDVGRRWALALREGLEFDSPRHKAYWLEHDQAIDRFLRQARRAIGAGKTA